MSLTAGFPLHYVIMRCLYIEPATQAIADSAGDWPALVGFLQRRHELPASAPLAAQPRQLLVGVARAALTERLSLGTVRLIFDRLLQVCLH
jgi:hypothetical protein